MDFLGVLTRTEYWEPYAEIAKQYPADRDVRTDYPAFGDEYIEWIDLLEAIVAAKDHFTMIEIGAGWARWVANAGAALRHTGGIPYTCIAVEAEPTHFRWMAQHLADNSMDPANFRLIEAAVAATDGKIGFHVGETQWGGPSNYYAHSIGGSHLVDAVSLRTLLQPLPVVDLIDLDIQGAELEVLAAGADQLDEKVKRVHIGTHGQRIEEGLHSLFSRLGWTSVHNFPGNSTADTLWGKAYFLDGVQTWVNPTFVNPNGNDLAIVTDKLHASRREAERLWAELEKAREEQNQLSLMRHSVAWKFIEKGRRLRDRIVPIGSRRRRILDSLSKGIRGKVE